MIRETEVMALLGNEIPRLRAELEKIDDVKSPYKMARCLVNFTCASIARHETTTSRKCLKVAEKILQDGDRGVRSAFENIFVQQLACTLANDEAFMEQLPPLLQLEYSRHCNMAAS